MKTKHLVFLAFLLFAGINGIFAQEKFDVRQPYTVDENVLIGQLPNGLKYYIRHNEDPKDRGQFWLVVNVGAMQEDPDQNGLAHFLEHMAFNGTKNFEKDQIIRYLQSIGMRFGPEINAFTSHDVTNYMLQNVPLEHPAHIDTALLILFDWANQLTLDGEEIDKERGVIHEEWRTGMGSQRRIRNAYFRTLFKDSKYASHNVIGDMNIVLNFDHEAIRRFYRDWYRPDLQAIIAIGDFDEKEVQKKIVDLFGQIPKVENPKPRTPEMIPEHDKTRVAVVTDKEAQMVQLMVFHKHPAITERATLEYSRDKITHSLYNAMLNARFRELVQQAEPPFVMAMSNYSSMVKTSDMYMTMAFLNNPDPSDALAALLRENMRVLRFGFNESELERAKNEYLASLEKRYNERDNRKSESFAWEYYRNFTSDEPIPGIEFEYEMIKSFMPGITLEEINALAHKWITEDNRVVVLTAPEAYADALPDEEKILKIIAEAESEALEAYVDDVTDKPLHSLELKPGKVKKTKFDKSAEYYEWTLSNGAKVVIKPTKFRNDEILFSAYSKGGTSLYGDADLVTAQFTSDVIDMSGIGEFNNIELGKQLSGKVVRISPYISTLEEGFSGSTTPKDLTTMLELLNLYFMSPRADQQAFQTYMNRQRAFLQNRSNDPSSAFSDTLTNTLFNYHPRRRPMTVELLDEADFGKMADIFSERFSNASDWTFYFVGNIDPVAARPLIELYLGSIPGSKKHEQWIDRKDHAVEGVIKKRIHTQMEIPKATVVVMKGGEFDYSPRERMLLSFVSDILDVKYIQTVREDEGGTYGVSVRTSMSQYPKPTYRFMAYFTCAPERVDELTAIIYQQIELLKSEGPTQQDVDNVIQNKLKERAEQVKENRFWLRGLKFKYENGQNTLDTEAYNKLVRSITREDVQKTAQRYLDGSNVIEIIQLPKE